MERTRALIVTAFKAWHEALPSPMPVIFDNLPGPKTATGPWARVSVQQGSNWQPFVGGRTRQRCIGFLTVQIFVPEDAGVTVATAYAQQMAEDWDNTTLAATDGEGVATAVLFRNTSLLLIAAHDGYQQFNASAEFQRDTIRT